MLAFLTTIAVAQIFDQSTPPWTCGEYKDFFGPTDPDICKTGIQQSPINIQSGIATPIFSDELDLKMYYEPMAKITLDDARSKWKTDTKDSYVTSKGVRYDLIQFHFHAPSEHTIDGVIYPAEIHFVHQNPLNGKLLVVGLLFSSDSAVNSTLIENLSDHQDLAEKTKTVKLYEHPAVRGIEEAGYYHYDGSLTAPPCIEGLIWVVSKYVAPANMLQICAHYENGDKSLFETTRRVLPLNGRTIKESVWAKHSTAVQPDSTSSVSSTGATVSVMTSSTTETNNDSEGGTVEAPAVPKESMAPLLGGGEIAAIVLGALILMVLSGLLSAFCAIKVLRGSGRVNTLAVGSTPKTNGITGI